MDQEGNLKERLRDPANHCPDNMGCNCAPVCVCALNDEALARIEELEKELSEERERRHLWENSATYTGKEIVKAQATIAKLEGERAEIERLRSSQATWLQSIDAADLTLSGIRVVDRIADNIELKPTAHPFASKKALAEDLITTVIAAIVENLKAGDPAAK